MVYLVFIKKRRAAKNYLIANICAIFPEIRIKMLTG